MKLQKSDFHVIEIKEQEDGSANVVMEISDEFKEWFCRAYNLTEFSQEKFQMWFLEAMHAYIDNQKPVQPKF